MNRGVGGGFLESVGLPELDISVIGHEQSERVAHVPRVQLGAHRVDATDGEGRAGGVGARVEGLVARLLVDGTEGGDDRRVQIRRGAARRARADAREQPRAHVRGDVFASVPVRHEDEAQGLAMDRNVEREVGVVLGT